MCVVSQIQPCCWLSSACSVYTIRADIGSLCTHVMHCCRIRKLHGELKLCGANTPMRTLWFLFVMHCEGMQLIKQTTMLCQLPVWACDAFLLGVTMLMPHHVVHCMASLLHPVLALDCARVDHSHGSL